MKMEKANAYWYSGKDMGPKLSTLYIFKTVPLYKGQVWPQKEPKYNKKSCAIDHKCTIFKKIYIHV